MATIYDVAARAGVSPATVSRVFNGSTVSAERARLVREAAEDLGYTPNRSARALRTQTSNVIALVVADIENPFFTALARGVEDAAAAAGYSVVLCNSDEDPAREARYLDVAVSEHMAGVVLVPASAASDLSPLIGRNKPVVIVDRTLPRFPVDSVVADNTAGGREGTERLYERGFTRVACITGPRTAQTAAQRGAGWLEVFRTRSPGLEPGRYLEHADYRLAGGRRAMVALLDRPEPPDAVFVANNLMALGALEELVERDAAPPAFGMAVFGDLPYFPLAPRGIEVVPLPARRLGETAAALLLDRIGGSPSTHRTVVLGGQGEQVRPPCGDQQAPAPPPGAVLLRAVSPAPSPALTPPTQNPVPVPAEEWS